MTIAFHSSLAHRFKLSIFNNNSAGCTPGGVSGGIARTHANEENVIWKDVRFYFKLSLHIFPRQVGHICVCPLCNLVVNHSIMWPLWYSTRHVLHLVVGWLGSISSKQIGHVLWTNTDYLGSYNKALCRLLLLWWLLCLFSQLLLLLLCWWWWWWRGWWLWRLGWRKRRTFYFTGLLWKV